MSAGKYDILIEKGATFQLYFVVKAAGVPMDLTGWKARMKVRPDYDQPEISQMTSTTENGRIVLQPSSTAGAVQVTVAATDTEDVVLPDGGVWDIELVNDQVSPEFVMRVLQGKAKLSLEATYG